MDEIRKVLYEKCIAYVNQRLQTIEEIIQSNQKALQTATKSSAGDKHETERAMLQLEMEKAGQQLANITEMKIILAKMNISEESDKAHLGSVIKTNFANYFLSISAGKLEVLGESYFAVSISSPIGKVLLGKDKGDVISFNAKEIIIQQIF
ncbi:3-oxoacyl-ACP synthase [Tenacibaculum maritimum]|uniref:3-oxoacyl-ACP synthase n=1 Tax=Tenacibaculum maritimum TaxID=107401 RepID=UPI0012E416A9|nr:3-oxoacyl-ACP synthase [Tenacibaculum maritimum]CAA0246929.1 conserved hypothetical protein [Tenacibaculum maritimum]